jgi:hypothetical protein
MVEPEAAARRLGPRIRHFMLLVWLTALAGCASVSEFSAPPTVPAIAGPSSTPEPPAICGALALAMQVHEAVDPFRAAIADGDSGLAVEIHAEATDTMLRAAETLGGPSPEDRLEEMLRRWMLDTDRAMSQSERSLRFLSLDPAESLAYAEDADYRFEEAEFLWSPQILTELDSDTRCE